MIFLNIDGYEIIKIKPNIITINKIIRNKSKLNLFIKAQNLFTILQHAHIQIVFPYDFSHLNLLDKNLLIGSLRKKILFDF